MDQPTTRLALTRDHIAKICRDVPDTGPGAGVELHTEAEYRDWVQRILASNPEPGRPISLFAYGSLIWKPEIDYRSEELAMIHGWHRSFCLKMTRFRGSPDAPGLMMALDRGGRCRGVLYGLEQAGIEEQLYRLFRREFTVKPINNVPRWLNVETANGPRSAIGFVMNQKSPSYAGRLSLEAVAEVLATACGPVGSCAEYLLNTVQHLEARGVRDGRLWRLQELVAARIEAGIGTEAL